jgi:hypothetical protein
MQLARTDSEVPNVSTTLLHHKRKRHKDTCVLIMEFILQAAITWCSLLLLASRYVEASFMINSDFLVVQPEDIGNRITGVESCLFLITLYVVEVGSMWFQRFVSMRAI